jgi:thiol-disulfide isomerase/thioredoxin
MKTVFLHLVLSLLLVLSHKASVAQSAEPPQNTETSATANKAVVQLVNWEEAEAMIAAQKGKIVVVDFWSTWCEPCVKEFPHFTALQKQLPNDVVCISLNCNFIGDDALEEERGNVLEFLAKHPSSAKHLMSNIGDEELYKKAGISSVPVARVFDRSGKLHTQFDNDKNLYGKDGFQYEKHIVPLVEMLVKAAPRQ